MRERNHAAQASTISHSKPKIVMVLAGTLAGLLTAVLLFEIFRAETGAADEKRVARNNTDLPDNLRHNQQPGGRLLARITNVHSQAKIYEDEVARECLARIGKDVLDSIINQTIIQLACQQEGLSVKESEIDQEIARIAKEFNLPMETWYQMLQTERNLSPLQYRRDVIWPMLALKKLTREKITITDKDMLKAFEHHYGPRVKARMILLENDRHAHKVWNLAIKHPEDFDRLAREYSVDPNSKALDGTIPPIPQHSGNPTLEETAFKLRKGEISGIIQAGRRSMILKCEGRTEQVVEDIDQVREYLYHDLMKQQVQESVSRVFAKLKETTRVDNYLTNKSTGDVRLTSGSNSGRVQRAKHAQQASR